MNKELTKTMFYIILTLVGGMIIHFLIRYLLLQS
jgi:hypothetical protein